MAAVARPAWLRSAQVLGGRYRLVELLGQGGMATIYRAHDAQLGRDVAVKVLRAGVRRGPRVRRAGSDARRSRRRR